MTGSEAHTRKLAKLAQLFQDIHEAGDFQSMARAMVRHWTQANSADASQAPGQLEAALETALAEHALQSSLAGSQPFRPPVSKSRARPLKAVIDQIAQRLADSPESELFRLCVPCLTHAASVLAARAMSQPGIEACRRLEESGAPAAMLFSLTGRPLWGNGALRQLLFRRDLAEDQLAGEAHFVVQPMLETYWRAGLHASPARGLTRRSRALDLHFTASMFRVGRQLGEQFVRVTVSEARRATELSGRELEIARKLVGLRSYKAVATDAGISLDTVRTFVRRIYRKLAVNNLYDLHLRLIHDGLLSN